MHQANYTYEARIVADNGTTIVQVNHIVEGVRYYTFTYHDGVRSVASLQAGTALAMQAVDYVVRSTRDMRIL